MSAGALRPLLFVILIAVCLPGILAQEAGSPESDGSAIVDTGDSAGAEPAPDTHTAAERAIVFGDAGAGNNQPPAASSAIGGIIRMVLTLALVAAAIYGLVLLLKKTTRTNVTPDPFIKVLASAPIGTNRGLYVVSVGSQTWLVGAAEHGLNLISEITDKQTVDAMLLEDSRRASQSPSGRMPDFKSMLRKFGLPAESGAPSPADIRKRSERLKGM